MASDTRRNDPCPCGSGRKYKSCCMNSSPSGPDRRTLVTLVIAGAGAALAALLGMTVNATAAKLAVGAAAIAAAAWWLFSDPPSSRGGGDPGAINFGN